MEIKEATEAIKEHFTDLIDLCPHCGAKVHIEKLWSDHHQHRNGDLEFYVAFKCKPCKKILIKTFIFEQNEYSSNTNLKPIGWKEKFPSSLEDELSNEEKEFIPKEVLTDYQEALKCISIGANRASCSMFRRALQSSLLAIGANHKFDLIKQIEALDTLPGDIKDWAHQIRIFGNWGAHPDKDNLKEVGAEDVNETHDFISKFLMYTFIMPEKVRLSRAKRDAKTKGKQAVNNEDK